MWLSGCMQAVYDIYDIAEGPTWDQYLHQQHRNKQNRAQTQDTLTRVGNITEMSSSRADEASAEGSQRSSSQGRCTKLVVIGRYLDRQKLQDQLEACAVT